MAASSPAWAGASGQSRSACAKRAGPTSERPSSANSAPAAAAKPGAPRRAGQHLEPGVGDRRAHHPLARDRPQDA